MPKPLISIIIPTYNRASSIMNAVSSVLKQSFTGFELLVIDDGSTDGTSKLFENPADQRVSYHYQQNLGVSGARNTGISMAQGDWLAFLDSDDSWLPKKLETQLAVLEKTKTLWNHTEEIWIRNGKRVNQMNKHRKSGGRIFIPSLPLCVVSPSSVVIHRSLFEQCGVFDPLLPVAEDYDLWLRIAARFDISFCEKPLINKFGGHGDQLSRLFLGMDRYRVRAMRKHLNSEYLSAEEQTALRNEIRKKAEVLAAGYIKHGKPVVAEFYSDLLKTL